MNTLATNQTAFFSLDVEADGPCPGLYSMVSFALVDIFDHKKTFYAQIKPISDEFIPEALAVSGFSREECMSFPEASVVMQDMEDFLVPYQGRKVIVSDNPGFDWQFLNYYCHKFLKRNPFGHSARRIGDIWAGHTGNFRNDSQWKKYRGTKHSHNALDDALGNAQALEKILSRMKHNKS